MTRPRPRRPLEFVGSSRQDLRALPEGIQDEIGFLLDLIQQGRQVPEAKWLSGYPGVQELRVNDEAGTYRTVYVLTLTHAIYVLHCFQKKARHGIKTPKVELDLISARLKEAKETDHGK